MLNIIQICNFILVLFSAKISARPVCGTRSSTSEMGSSNTYIANKLSSVRILCIAWIAHQFGRHFKVKANEKLIIMIVVLVSCEQSDQLELATSKTME